MSASTTSWDARKTELELPEEIDLQVELANVGSRTLAILVDIALGGLVLFIVYALTMLLAHDEADDWLTKTSSNVLKTTAHAAHLSDSSGSTSICSSGSGTARRRASGCSTCA